MKIKTALIVFGLFCVSSSVCDEWIIIEDQGLEHEYAELRNAHMAKASSNRLEDIDEFMNTDPKELAKICAQLRDSKIYQRVPLMMQFPQPKDLPKLDHKEETAISYEFKTLKTEPGSITGKIPAFFCKTHADMKSYWVTFGYGHNEKRLFLLRELDIKTETLSFVGQAELVPKVDEKYTRGKLLDQYYYQRIFRTSPLEMDNMHPFAASSMYRLCCLIDAARPKEKSFKINYANGDLGSAFVEHQLKLERPKPHPQEVPHHAAGCVVNRAFDGEIAFYVRSDKEDENSVFVLDEIIEEGEKKLVVSLTIHDLNIPVKYTAKYL